MERRNRIGDMLISLPLAHQVVIGIAAVVLLMAAFLFFQWVSTPSYTVLYSNLDDATLATVVDELDRQGVSYEIEAGGSRVLVPKSEVYSVRAALATAGVQSGAAPQGYSLLDDQGLNVSDFRQRVDYQRALEGEMELTLLAMNDITNATVHLVIPEESLFAEDEEPVTASVLLETSAALSELEIETVTFLVASGVEGLEPKNVTVADVDGAVLHAAGDIAAESAVSNRNLRMTRDFEASLATDVRNLLTSVTGEDSASVVVRAQLDFDEQSVETQTYDEDSAVALRESTIDETYVGAGTPPGGTLGVEGETVVTDTTGEYTYDRAEVIREYGVDSVISREITAPGKVEQLSVAVVMDDGSLTGITVPEAAEVEALVSAAVGLDTTRGDTISVSAIAYPVPEVVEEEPVAEAASMDPMAMIPQVVGGLVLLIVVVALLLMARGSSKKTKAASLEVVQPALSGGGSASAAVGESEEGASIHPEVMNLVQRQPEEIAVLLRSWLADRR
ncbi:MAG: flagellar basal-body MS-ring/collar protein FliF [Acidimicrobiia bacterium]|nr:flagellar basal-body MS-ring/collar protein FliF [Acidimicrobiia bacterium]